jgi:hypothetical protein
MPGPSTPNCSTPSRPSYGSICAAKTSATTAPPDDYSFGKPGIGVYGGIKLSLQ